MSKNRLSLKSILVDLLIVIIGITIAFWLNNWNEARKLKEVEISFITDLKEEMLSDSSLFSFHVGISETTIKRLDTFIEICKSKDYTNDSLNFYVNSLMDRNFWLLNSNSYQTLVAGGKLDVISSIEYRKLINRFYTSRVIDTRRVSDEGNRFLEDHLRPFLYKNSDWYINTYNVDPSFVKTREFQNLLARWRDLAAEKLQLYNEIITELTYLINESNQQLSLLDAPSRN